MAGTMDMAGFGSNLPALLRERLLKRNLTRRCGLRLKLVLRLTCHIVIRKSCTIALLSAFLSRETRLDGVAILRLRPSLSAAATP